MSKGQKEIGKEKQEGREKENKQQIWGKDHTAEERWGEAKEGKMVVKANSTHIMVRSNTLETMDREEIEERKRGVKIRLFVQQRSEIISVSAASTFSPSQSLYKHSDYFSPRLSSATCVRVCVWAGNDFRQERGSVDLNPT